MQVAMISSTALDLPEYRMVARDICLEYGITPKMMEHLGARDSDAISESLRLVDECDLYVGIFAHRYGHIPEGHDISICEMEYDRAVECGVPRLIFMMDEDLPVLPSRMDRGDKHTKLERFKTEKIGEDRCAVFFKSPEQFGQQLTSALARFASVEVDGATDPHNLIANDPYFVGRDDEIAEIKELIRTGKYRIVSILGPPGVGKTELAIHLGRSLLGSFDGQGRLIEMSQAKSIDGVCVEVAEEFRVRLTGDNKKNVQQIEQVFHSLSKTIIVFDNFEQAVEAAEATVGVWSRACENILFIVTSRSALHVAGELNYHLPPLDAPASRNLPFAELRTNESICVFEEHAQRRDREFALTPDNIRAIAEICEEVEYHPFSIIVVAQHILTHEPEEMLEELSHLKEKAWPPLEMTMRRLAAHVQRVLIQLSLFEDGFDRAAVMAVVRMQENSKDDVIGVISTLCDHCFLKSFRARTGKRRIAFYHRSVKEFVESKFREDGDEIEPQLRERWSQYYADFINRWSANVDGGDSRQALDLIIQERENLLAVHEWLMKQGNVQLAGTIIVKLSPSLRIRGPVGIAALRLAETLDHPGDLEPTLKARLLVEMGHANWVASKWKEAVENADQSLEIATHAEDRHAIALSKELKGLMLYYKDQWQEADEHLMAANSIFEEVGDLLHSASTLRTLAVCREHKGGFDDMMQTLEKALSLAQQSDSLIERARIINSQGLCYWRFGYPHRALASFEEAQQMNVLLGDRMWIAGNTTNAGAALTDLGLVEEALERFDNAEQLHASVGNLAWLAVNECMRGRAFIYQGNYELGLEVLRRAREAADKVGYKESVALCNLVIGHGNIELGLFGKAIESLNHALAYHVGNDHQLSIRCWIIAVLLARASKEVGDYDEAERCLELAKKIQTVVRIDPATKSLVYRQYISVFDELSKAN